jgi:hypothetical membrane protein
MEWPVTVMLGIGILGILGIIIWMGFLTQNKDKGSEIKIQLGIIAGVTAVLVGIFAVAAYMYFTANVNYLTPFLLWMTFFNIFLSVFAVSVSTIQVVNG